MLVRHGHLSFYCNVLVSCGTLADMVLICRPFAVIAGFFTGSALAGIVSHQTLERDVDTLDNRQKDGTSYP